MSEIVPLAEVHLHRPFLTKRQVLELRAKRLLPVCRVADGRRLYADLAHVDALVTTEPALRGPLAERS